MAGRSSPGRRDTGTGRTSARCPRPWISASTPLVGCRVRPRAVRIDIVGSANTADPLASADDVHFGEAPSVGSFRVFEHAATVDDVKGGIDTIHFEGSGQVADPSVGFVTSTAAPSDVTPVPGTGPAVVPEPAPVDLLGTGVAAVAATSVARRRRPGAALRLRARGR